MRENKKEPYQCAMARLFPVFTHFTFMYSLHFLMLIYGWHNECTGYNKFPGQGTERVELATTSYPIVLAQTITNLQPFNTRVYPSAFIPFFIPSFVYSKSSFEYSFNQIHCIIIMREHYACVCERDSFVDRLERRAHTRTFRLT